LSRLGLDLLLKQIGPILQVPANITHRMPPELTDLNLTTEPSRSSRVPKRAAGHHAASTQNWLRKTPPAEPRPGAMRTILAARIAPVSLRNATYRQHHRAAGDGRRP
jgi:hypothetical protein